MLDRNIAIDNINKLMSAKNIRQINLCEVLHISQPQLSKLMSAKVDRFFSADQLCVLADYFDVSIDFLLGRTTEDNTNAQAICRYIVDWITKGKASYIKGKINEDVYEECDPNDNGGLPYGHVKKDNSYFMIYFPQYINPNELIDSPEDEMYLLTHGNINDDGKAIQDFLTKFFKYYDLLMEGVMDEDIFREVINGLLAKM